MAAILRISLCQPFRRLIGPVKTLDRTGSKFEIQRANFSQKPTVHWEVDTKVAKDVVLFNYADGKFHKMLNLFAVTQFVFWLYLAQFSFTTLRDVPVKRTEIEDVPWYRNINLGDNKYRNGLSLMCICVGQFFTCF
jgi:TMEM70/TMEM186/TMEM223 protein family